MNAKLAISAFTLSLLLLLQVIMIGAIYFLNTGQQKGVRTTTTSSVQSSTSTITTTTTASAVTTGSANSTTTTPSTTTIQISNQNVQSQPWQMFHGSSQHTGYANAIGPQSASLKWRFMAGSGTGNPPTSVAVSSKSVIYLAGSSTVYALTANGTVIWQQGYQGPQGPAISRNGSVLYFVAENSIFALNASTGTQEWTFKTNGSTIFGPAIDPISGVIYQGSWDGYLYAVNPNGGLKWKYKTAGCVSYPASVSPNGIVYLGGGDAHCGGDPNIYSFNPSGILKWKYNTTSLRVGSIAIIPNGTVYAPASPTLFALSPSGILEWQLPAKNSCGPPPLPPCGNIQQISGIITPAIGADGTIYLGNSIGAIEAINPRNQKVLWVYQTGPSQQGTYGLPSFPIVDAKGNAYFGAEDGKIYALNENGTILWTYKTGGPITEASPAIGPDGTLYFTSQDGYLYAIN